MKIHRPAPIGLALTFLLLLLIPTHAAPITTETTSIPTDWTVERLGKPILTYSYAPGRYKPYVKVLATLDGRNVLRDAPADHLHHHALMFAIRVNGLNFWEEIAGSGIQLPVQTTPIAPESAGPGVSRARLLQTLHWVAPESAFLPDTLPKAILVERRSLQLIVDETQGEVALEWRSEFEVGPAQPEVTLGGSSYFGLGARFLGDLDASATHFTTDGPLDLSNQRQDVSQHPWVAVSFDPNRFAGTFAILGHPRNPTGLPKYFSMKSPFAYLSATEGLDRQPRILRRGDRYALQHLVILASSSLNAETLNARYQRWLRDRP